MEQALKGNTAMKVTIQKVMNVKSPTRAYATKAGLDLYVPEGQGCIVRCGDAYTIDLGIRVAIPDGYYGQLTIRSAAWLKGLSIPHGVGIIDAGYRGNVKVTVTTLTDPTVITAGDRICQLIILPLLHIDTEDGIVDDSTDRSEGSFGSTGATATVRDYATQEAGTLTIGRLMEQLRDAALRYGDDTPVAVPAGGGVGYEQADGLLMVNTIKTGRVCGWDQYRADTDGTPMAVIS